MKRRLSVVALVALAGGASTVAAGARLTVTITNDDPSPYTFTAVGCNPWAMTHLDYMKGCVTVA